ncbi:MAG TPA: IS110 family transposase [Thermodesulfobacteriota bacterium]|nr:IS110 family transposase [Thermodesulfobacteriota bacterium]
MNYVGIDYHKKYSHVTAINNEGKVIRSNRLENKPEVFREFFKRMEGPSEAVLEASRTWGVMYDLLAELDGVELVELAHPQKVRAIAEAKIKTDKIDSHILAQLLRADLIPAAYIPGKRTRSYKEMLRQRVFLVRMRTRLKNRIHVLLDRLHIPFPSVTDIFGKRGTTYLRKLNLPGVDGEILREDLELLEVFNKLVKEAEQEMASLLGDDPQVKLLRTIPGLGPILAAVVAMEIDQIERFIGPSKLASYAGLVPSTYASGGRIFHGKLLPMSNKWLRWALVEAAWGSIRTSPYCRIFFENHKRRKGPHTAAIALARRLSEIIWHVLTEKRAYEERPSKWQKQVSISPAALTAT